MFHTGDTMKNKKVLPLEHEQCGRGVEKKLAYLSKYDIIAQHHKCNNKGNLGQCGESPVKVAHGLCLR